MTDTVKTEYPIRKSVYSIDRFSKAKGCILYNLFFCFITTMLLLKILPDIKIILASGYSEDILKGEFADIENMSFIPKPFSLSDLTQKVYEVINS